MAEMSTAEWSPTWSVGERIRKAREDRGWLQTDLAIHMHVSRTTIAAWESNTNRPNWATFKTLAETTGAPQWWLEGLDAPPSGGIPTLQDRRSRNRSQQDIHVSRCLGQLTSVAA